MKPASVTKLELDQALFVFKSELGQALLTVTRAHEQSNKECRSEFQRDLQSLEDRLQRHVELLAEHLATEFRGAFRASRWQRPKKKRGQMN